jgi:hypothetical protein
MYLLHNGPITFFFEQAEIDLNGSVAKASFKLILTIRASSSKENTRNQVIYA